MSQDTETVKILFEIVSYFFEYDSFKLDIYFFAGHSVRLRYVLLNHLKFRILGNKEILGKPQNNMTTQPNVQFPQQKYGLSTGAQIIGKSRYQCFLVLSSFAWFLKFSQNILHMIVCKLELDYFFNISNAVK